MENRKNKKKYRTYNTMRITALAVAAGLIISLGGCADKKTQNSYTGEKNEEPVYQDNLNAVSPSVYSHTDGLNLEPGTYISVIGKEESSAYWKTVKAGVMQAAEDLNKALGYKGADKIKVTFNAPAKSEDFNEQVNILDEEMGRDPDVIAIACIDETAYTVQFDMATDNGIPIIALDSGNAYPGIQCTVGTDNNDATRTGAYKLADEIGGSGEVILLVHDSTSESAKEREAGFCEKISESYQDVTIAETIYCDRLEDLKKAIAEEKNAELEEGEKEFSADSMSDEEVIQYYIRKHPEVKGIFGTNVNAVRLGLSAVKAEGRAVSADQKDTTEESGQEADKETEKETVQEADEETSGEDSGKETEAEAETEEEEKQPIVLVGFDGGEEQIDSLRKGEIAGLVIQNPFGIGYASVIAAARTVLQIGNEAEVNTGYIWVTCENLDSASIQNMLYE
ncbi:MAG: substrate-binding domain-containing protein [Schaedlerella sp.]|nr:substrate-binding domain-containing protein [Lachnospiraceae bacterium]MDY4202730.1 substrate-binding domain-containing protein [Schaedlerella sp.]